MTIKKLTLGNLAASFLTEFFGHAACAGVNIGEFQTR